MRQVYQDGTNVVQFSAAYEFSLIRGPRFSLPFFLSDERNQTQRRPSPCPRCLQAMPGTSRYRLTGKPIAALEFHSVFATQNPIEYEGTYPLPEAQKDRFMLKISMPPPARADELALAQRTLTDDAPEALLARGAVRPVIREQDLDVLKRQLAAILIREELIGYLVDLVRATRQHESILVGAGPRATQALIMASRAAAALAGRDFVTPDDVKAMAPPVLEHRLILRPEFEIEGLTVPEVIQQILQTVPVPR
jgi:MoxR-like ATPase